jgi:hypothetical protein
MEIGIGIIIGIVLTYLTGYFFKRKKSIHEIEKQSVVLIEKVKSVCKLISVEADFAEIYHYENTKSHLLKMVSTKKKAIILINAKAHVGFDLRQIQLEADTANREIVLTHFPQPKILSVDTDVRYYDKRDNLFNRFDAADLTDLIKESKDYIISKIPESGLLDSARKEALDTLQIIEKLLETSGWYLNYTQLRLPEAIEKNKLEN